MSKRTPNSFFGAIILLSAVCFMVGDARAASFSASLDRDTIALGETATLSLKFDGAAPQNQPSLPAVAGVNVSYVGEQSLDININGVPDSIRTFTYSLAPQRAGQFAIPTMAINSSGQTLTSQPLKLTVTPAGASPTTTAANDSGSQIASMKLTLPQDKLYAGQTVVADLKIYYRQDTQIAQQPQVTALPAEGFTVGKIVSDNQYREQIGNAVFNVLPAKVPLTATKTGPVTIGPITISLLLNVPSNNRQADPFFQQFGIQMFGGGEEQKRFSLATELLTVQSRPLPKENVPANFNGAVGNYTMTVTAGPTNVAVGDPVTVRVQISGQGALDNLQLPDQSGWNDFKTFPPTSKVDTSDQLGLDGTKTFEEIVTPQDTNVRALPEFSFSFFNPDDGHYHTLTQPPVQLAVHSGGTTPLPTIAANAGNAQKPQESQDILPVKDDLGAIAQVGTPLITQPAFLAVQTLPVLAFLGALVWRKRTDNLANNPRLRRQRAVALLIVSGMDELKKYAAANQPDEFFATLFRLLQEQLGERLDCPASAITENVVDEHALLRSAPDVTRVALREQFQLCNQARYAPVRGTSELNFVAAQFEKLIGQLRELKA